MKEKLRRFLQGRNGSDGYSVFLSWAAMAILLLSLLLSSVWSGIPSNVLYIIAMFCVIYSTFRIFSKDITKRQAENVKYFAVLNRIKGKRNYCKQWISDRKSYRYFTCPTCKAKMRVPKGKGKVQITCKNCGTRFPGNT